MRRLKCLLGMLMSGLVIFFAVVRRSNAVCVCGEFVEFGSSLVRVIWHSFPNLDIPRILEPFHFSSCPIMNTRAAAMRSSAGVGSAQTEADVNEMEPSAQERKVRSGIFPPLCPGECPKVDRRMLGNELLIELRIYRVRPTLRKRR
jgi:hypothetical protein